MRKFLFALSAVALGCGGSDAITGTSGAINGTYALQTVAGASLPVTVFEIPGYTLRLTGGNIVINSASTFTARYDWQETDSGVTTNFTDNCTGTYTRGGNNVSFTEAESGDFCGGNFSGTWNGSSTITVLFAITDQDTIEAVYVR